MVRDVAWVIFARAGSSRLPNKCYLPLGGKISIELITSDIVSNGYIPEDIYLSTSRKQENLILIQIAKSLGISVIMGSENLPSQRLLGNIPVISKYKSIIRICGDSPLYPSCLATKALEIIDSNNLEYDVVTNVLERQFPPGASIEIYNTQYLIKSLLEQRELLKSEHLSEVALYASRMRDRLFHIRPSATTGILNQDRLTIDTLADAERLTLLFESGEATSIINGFRNISVYLSDDKSGYDFKCL